MLTIDLPLLKILQLNGIRIFRRYADQISQNAIILYDRLQAMRTFADVIFVWGAPIMAFSLC